MSSGPLTHCVVQACIELPAFLAKSVKIATLRAMLAVKLLHDFFDSLEALALLFGIFHMHVECMS